MKTKRFVALGTLAGASMLPAVFAAVGAQEFEEAPILQANQVLPPNLVSGPNHTVDETVENDGVLNRYTLRIPQGDLSVIGTDRLEIWIEESNALQVMEEVKQSEVFGESVKKSVQAPVKFAGDMVTDPIVFRSW